MAFPTIVILAGGKATRMYPKTLDIPKALVPVNGQPFIYLQLEVVRSQGLDRVVLCIGHLGEMIRDAVGDGSRFGIKVEYSFDGPALRGTGGALKNAQHLLGSGPFFVMYGDSYLTADFRAVHSAFRSSGLPALMTLSRRDSAADAPNVAFADGLVLRYGNHEPTSDLAYVDYGLEILTSTALELMPDRLKVDLGELYERLAAAQQLAGLVVEEPYHEIGSPLGLEETERYLRRLDARPGSDD